MRRSCTKLLGLCLITGIGFQTAQTAQAHTAHKNTYRKVIKHTKTKVKPHRNRYRQSLYQNDNANADPEPQSNSYHLDDTQAESGTASWYGGRHNRIRTASGKKFDSKQLTAAHPTLPLGTKVLVRSDDSGNSVVVTINDRGPYKGNRIIDLSKAAAGKIGMLHQGTAHVTVTPIDNTEVAMAPE
ncbi:Peptidoglycan lytic transglycosylase RlpA [Commensalibacter communis]|uniref:septal ring lytic transglycosylase RlpA family protein n=1 Tax=Commensalibacter communis TaxID=2972786 RepID=UPI0022FFB53A|nr:septal ring lytic transglycosylase RlpA family protein [Commensalibacter communis]CAI3942695.1 Peptidoglycan lytic transglycosylase RlpA [Commensalibacter communis]